MQKCSKSYQIKRESKKYQQIMRIWRKIQRNCLKLAQKFEKFCAIANIMHDA